MKSGDLVVFSNQNPHPSMIGWFGRLALVLESQIWPVSRVKDLGNYERITVLLEGRVTSQLAKNWSVVEAQE